MDLDAMAEHGDMVAGLRPPKFDRVVLDAAIRGEPIVFKRPRFNGKTGRTFDDTAYTEAKQGLAWSMLEQRRGACAHGPVRLEVTFYRRNRGRVDIDNLLKAVLDAGNGVLWLDDSQVVEVMARKVLGLGTRANTRLLVRDSGVTP